MNKISLPQFKGNPLLLHAVAHIDIKNICESIALQHSNFHICGLLEDREADVNCRNINGATPLHYAVQIDNPMVVEILLKYKADPNLQEYQEIGLRTPLHYAIEKNSYDCCKKLLEYGANPNIQDLSGLHVAAKEGFKDIVNLLLAHGVDINLRDRNGFNASYWAEQNKHHELLQLLPPPKSIPPEDFTEYKMQLREIHKITVKLGKKKKKKKK